MKVSIDVSSAIESNSVYVPTIKEFELWANTALQSSAIKPLPKAPEISIKIIDIEESQALNRDYRGKDKPTNVLSFQAEFPEEVDIPLLGDLAICEPVVAQEALEQNKEIKAHWAHMTIHGILHLLGYDHIEDDEADIMESIEIRLLRSLSYPNPYKVDIKGISD
ncbi:MAG: putative rRNA maturation factor [Cellvibrionaceae bacterium]